MILKRKSSWETSCQISTYINKAQCLLKAQFPQVNGLTLSLLQSKDLQPTGSVSNKIQIIHCSKRHHWVVATTVNCRDGEVIA